MSTVPHIRRTRLRRAIAEVPVTVSTICGFCGKGPFPSVPGLHKHIYNTPACNKARKAEFGSYVANIWREVPGQTDEDVAQTMDDHLTEAGPTSHPNEEAVQGLESPAQLDRDLDAVDDLTSGAPETQSDQGPPPTTSQRATVEEIPDEDAIPQSTREFRYVEAYPENEKAGATWGTGTPLFESIRLQQERDGDSIWGPFADEAEWELAEWLLRNVGQKQSDAYLKLPIVRFPCESF